MTCTPYNPGVASAGGRVYPEILRFIDDVPQISMSKCASVFSGNFDRSIAFCASDLNGGEDSCSGDSGGPLVVMPGSGSRSNNVVTQIGVVSNSPDPCGGANAPSWYVRVSGYTAWIATMVTPISPPPASPPPLASATLSPPVLSPGIPGATLAYIITFSVIVEGNVATFDEAAFLSGLSTFLNVPQSAISLTVTAASISVAIAVTVDTQSAANTAAAQIRSATVAELSTALDVTIASVGATTVERRMVDPASGSVSPTTDTEDAPCFSGDMTACRLVSSAVSPMEAYDQCFFGAPAITAERVLMTALVAGDVVLADGKTSTRVVVNQHVGAGKTSAVITIRHTEGSLSLTPDHVIELDGAFIASREAAAGATLSSGATVTAVSLGVSGIINPHTASGTILAADGVGKPVVAATGNEWLSSWLLSGYPKYTLTYSLAAAFPAAVQQYYNDIVEHMSLGTLAKFAHALPTPVVGGCLIIGDVVFVAGFVAFLLFSLSGAAALAALVALYALKK